MVDNTAAGPELVGAQARDQHLGEPLRIQIRQVRLQVAAQLVAEPGVCEHRRDGFAARGLVLQAVLQQLGQIADLGTPAPQRRGENVVLLLRPGHPRNGGKEQLGPVSRGHPPQLGSRAMQQHGTEAADLAVHAVRMSHRHPGSLRWRVPVTSP